MPVTYELFVHFHGTRAADQAGDLLHGQRITQRLSSRDHVPTNSIVRPNTTARLTFRENVTGENPHDVTLGR